MDVRSPPLKSDDHVSITISRQISNRGRERNMQAAVSMATELWEEKKKMKKQVAFNKFQVF